MKEKNPKIIRVLCNAQEINVNGFLKKRFIVVVVIQVFCFFCKRSPSFDVYTWLVDVAVVAVFYCSTKQRISTNTWKQKKNEIEVTRNPKVEHAFCVDFVDLVLLVEEIRYTQTQRFTFNVFVYVIFWIFLPKKPVFRLNLCCCIEERLFHFRTVDDHFGC